MPAPFEVDTTPLDGRLQDLGPVQLRQVRRTPDKELVNGLVEQHNYLAGLRPSPTSYAVIRQVMST